LKKQELLKEGPSRELTKKEKLEIGGGKHVIKV